MPRSSTRAAHLLARKARAAPLHRVSSACMSAAMIGNQGPAEQASLRGFAPALAVASLVLLLASCDGDGSGDDFNGTIELVVENADRCDPLDARHCLLPFPSNTFTVADSETDTGLRINLARESMIANAQGVHVDPTEWNRNDGFSPGQQMITYVEGLDVERSRIVGVTDIGGSLDPAAPIVLLDADTGERWPYWAELDASVQSDANRALLIRPAINLREGHRYVVALRNLRDRAGEEIEAGDVFRAYRDRLRSNVPEVEAQRDRYERLFADLARAGVSREDLYLAWDFTVASTRSLTERLLHMRDDAFGRLGNSAPRFTVTAVDDRPEPELLRRITGTFEVPSYMTGDGGPGQRLHYGADGLPEVNGVYSAFFVCNIPNAVLGESGAVAAARAAVYGHGLLGNATEINARNVRRMGDEHRFVFCATRWIGMSFEDIPNAVMILQDLSRFPTLADRLQQGVLNTLFLGRVMIHADGFSSHPAFRVNGTPVIDGSDLFYDGNSQGGIMGGIATAVSVDWTRAVLGVPAMNYSLLLQRSTAWDTYRQIYEPSYPDELERQLGIVLVQMLWDRGEANGYANHMTDDPLPNTPPHKVLLHIAFGDPQVSQDAAEIEARTVGARIHTPAVLPGRLAHFVRPYWGIEPIPSYPYDGSAIVIWDSGTPAPPTVNAAPRGIRDPHEDPRNDPRARLQKSEFLRTNGAVVDVCGGPCLIPVS